MKQTFALIGNAASPIVNFRLPLIQAILARGHAVFALAPDFSPADKEKLSGLGVTPVHFFMKRTGMNPVSDLSGAASIYRALRSISPDTVLSFGIKPAIYGNIAATLAHIPNRFVLVTGLGYAFTESGQKSRKRTAVGHLARSLYRLSLRGAHRVFLQNPDDTQEFSRLGIAPAAKLVTVNGTGVKLDDWAPAPPVLEPVICTLAARMVADKGIFEFVDAARILRKTNPRARFRLAGGLDANPQAIEKQQIIKWVEEGVVEWLGHVDMRQTLAQTSVFVLPSYREGVPRSTQEAMAMARPIVTTDAPGCRETVIDGQNGYLVPVRNADALAIALQRILDNPILIETMGKKSRQIAEERFDADKINAVMIDVMGL